VQNLTDKTIVITGSSDGLGKEIALKLSSQKCSLALLGRNEKRLKNVKEKCLELGAKQTQIFTFDLTDSKSIKQAIKSVIAKFKTIDILINNAGIWQKRSDLEYIDDQEISKVISTNLTGLIKITKECLPYLKKSVKNPSIINISSKSGFTAQEGQSVYSASKWGVRGFTEVLKTDLKKHKVRVAGVYQSGTNTKMFNKTGENMPLEKFTNPEDLADVVLFMLTRPTKLWLHEVRVEY